MIKRHKHSFLTILLSIILSSLFFSATFFVTISIFSNSSTFSLSIYDLTFGKNILILNKAQPLKGNIILLNIFLIPLIIILLELTQKFFIKSTKVRSYLIIALSSIYIIQAPFIKHSFSTIAEKFLLNTSTLNSGILNLLKNNLTVNVDISTLYYLIFLINLLIITINAMKLRTVFLSRRKSA